MIQTIQVDARNAVHAMEQSSQEVQVGVEMTSASALQEIIKMSEHVGDMVSRIDAAATEQAAASEEINGSVARISGSTQESSAASGETTTACLDLSRLAFDMQDLVNRFQLEEKPESVQPLPRSGPGSQKALSGKLSAKAGGGSRVADSLSPPQILYPGGLIPLSRK